MQGLLKIQVKTKKGTFFSENRYYMMYRQKTKKVRLWGLGRYSAKQNEQRKFYVNVTTAEKKRPA